MKLLFFSGLLFLLILVGAGFAGLVGTVLQKIDNYIIARAKRSSHTESQLWIILWAICVFLVGFITFSTYLTM